MSENLPVHEPLLVNAVGHSAGALVFGIFVFLLLRDRTGARLPGSRLAVTSAALALLWNASSLVVMTLPDPGSLAWRIVVAVSSTALSLLPAVLLQLSLGDRARIPIVSGYLLSAAAILVHLSEVVRPAPDHHRAAQLLITAGYGLLTAASVCFLVISGIGAPRKLTSRLVATMSLFLFALTFAHTGVGNPEHAWPVELVVHHAGIPFALFILLQDYRFIFLDAIVRFLVNVLLATLLATGVVQLVSASGLPHGPFEHGLWLAGGVLVLALFALIRGRLQSVLTRGVFRRPEVTLTLQELRSHPFDVSEQDYLEWATRRIAAFVEAEVVSAPEHLVLALSGHHLVYPMPSPALPELSAGLEEAGIEVTLPLRPALSTYLFLGRRRGGRRYLSEDLDALAHLCAQVVERIEQIRESERKRLAAQAELRALESQIHPHFLFNALNTIYGVIPKEAGSARGAVLNLADIFRYFLKSERTFIPLEEELRIIRSYLEIESLRLGSRLSTEIEVDEKALSVEIPVLSIEPLVENAVKHGIAPSSTGGRVRVEARLQGAGLLVRVTDTGRGFDAGAARRGVGLENVARRLKLCYGAEAGLKIESGAGGTSVELTVPTATAAEVHA